MSQDVLKIETVMRAAPVIPVLVVESPKDAVPMAEALVRGGLRAIEITLRTSEALAAIKAVSDAVEGAIVGAGTVLNGPQYDAAVAAGARFIVSPGATDTLLDAAETHDVPLLPGAATATEVMHLLDRGYSRLKFFPAEQAGGADYLKSLSSPLADAKFCPTGGIGLAKAGSYLALPNVLCVGGSWIADKAAIAAHDWKGIEARAREAAKLTA